MARCENCGWGEVEKGCDGATMCAECETALLLAQTEERSGEEVEA